MAIAFSVAAIVLLKPGKASRAKTEARTTTADATVVDSSGSSSSKTIREVELMAEALENGSGASIDDINEVIEQIELMMDVVSKATASADSALKNRTEEGNGLSQLDYELSRVDRMSGIEFEEWCVKLLLLYGFQNVKPTAASGDQGVDILAERNGVKYAMQCKCYSSDLGNKPIQEVYAGKTLYKCHVGVVITNRRFTSGGKAAAEATGVLLWDRDTLSYMLTPALEHEDYRDFLRKHRVSN